MIKYFLILTFIGLIFSTRLIDQKTSEDFPISIEELRKRSYPESNLVIEETLTPGANYQRHIASYQSDELKIYGLLTIPNLSQPLNGFPTIIFLHGYVLPQTYTPINYYVNDQDGLAKNGFITFKPDFRGHGKSQGIPAKVHFSENYLFDTL
ncbi:MAG: alpha/beta hydrolase, partial [Patescibacteria group bacterium]|nr:alpha/beta hydrolase [Patescibacteria group bacterium]